MTYTGCQSKSKEITLTVTNTGDRPGYAVPQLYIHRTQGAVTSRIRQLCGFTKLYLQPGEARTVTIAVPEESLRQFDYAMKEVLLPGKIGSYICLGAIILFGFTCLISFYTYAERAAVYVFGTKSRFWIKLLWVGMIFLGSQTTLGFAWDLADTINGLMIIPNLVGLLLLSGEVVKLKKEYFADRLPVHHGI